jgi:hypothetical protein
MFDRDRNPLEKFPTAPNLETIDSDAYEILDTKLEKRLARRNGTILKLGAAALTLTSISSLYWADVYANREERAQAHVSINVISELPDEVNAVTAGEHSSRKATVYIDGFNTYDANYLARSLGKAAQPVGGGEEWSLGYNNAILSREKIYKTILDTAEKRNIDSLSIVGYSMGGIVAVEATSDIVVNSTVEVDTFSALHTPNGEEGLQQRSKNELAFLREFVRWFPGAVDSTYVRYIGELISFKDLYTRGEFKGLNIAHNTKVITDNIGRFYRTANSLWDKVNNPKGTSLQLMLEQGYKIDNFNGKAELERMAAEADTKQMPVGLYMSMENDNTVNNKLSSEDFVEYSHETGIKIHVSEVAKAVHSEYDRTVKEYVRAFDNASTSMNRDVRKEKNKHEAFLAHQEEISILASE